MKILPLTILISSIAGFTIAEYDSTEKDPTTDLTFEKDSLLQDCSLWFDGCNTC